MCPVCGLLQQQQPANRTNEECEVRFLHRLTETSPHHEDTLGAHLVSHSTEAPGAKRPGCLAHLSSNVQVKNKWSYPPLPHTLSWRAQEQLNLQLNSHNLTAAGCQVSNKQARKLHSLPNSEIDRTCPR